MNSEGTDVYLVQSTKITGNLSLRLPLCVILILCVRKKKPKQPNPLKESVDLATNERKRKIKQTNPFPGNKDESHFPLSCLCT